MTKTFKQTIIVNIIVGAIFLTAGLGAMYWGAYSSCTDGGGKLRGYPPYMQCVGYSSADMVEYLGVTSAASQYTICQHLNDIGYMPAVTNNNYTIRWNP